MVSLLQAVFGCGLRMKIRERFVIQYLVVEKGFVEIRWIGRPTARQIDDAVRDQQKRVFLSIRGRENGLIMGHAGLVFSGLAVRQRRYQCASPAHVIQFLFDGHTVKFEFSRWGPEYRVPFIERMRRSIPQATGFDLFPQVIE